jgi:hypothetical protein
MEIIFFSIVLGVGLNLLLRYFVVTKKIFLPKRVFNVFIVLFIVFLCLFIASIFIASNRIHFVGYRSSSWIFVGMTLSGIITFAFQPYTNFIKPILLLPYAWVIVSTSLSGLLCFFILWNYKDDLVYSDPKYRLERRGWFITPCLLPSLFVKRGFFEKELQ